MFGPESAERAELGIALKDDVANARIVAQKRGGMCQYAVALGSAAQIGAELLAVLRARIRRRRLARRQGTGAGGASCRATHVEVRRRDSSGRHRVANCG
ncbi:MAG: hypothetical protein JWM38_163 [Sphingomonas bacterium]|nr:hypothetical protein [Sphingomonas bacterium]